MIQEIWHGDCLELMNKIDDNSIDFICIDPPYEIEYNNEKWDKKCLNWNIIFHNLNRILKDTGNLIIFQGWSNVAETIGISKNHFTLKNWIIYDRTW